jgi:hypothetical protein
MKRCIVSLLAALVILSAGGCGLEGIAGSGVSASRKVDGKDFTTVEVSGPFDVTLDRGDKFDVTVTGDDNLLQYVDAKTAAGKLSIEIQSGENLRPRFGLKVKINMPAVEAVSLEGACTGSINGFKGGKQLKVDVAGASTLNGEIQVDKLILEANGASQIKLTGQAHECRATAEAASELHLGDLAVGKAVVRLNAASSGVVKASDKLDYELNAASHLDYKGSPKIGTSQVEGASSVSQE